MKKSKPIEPAEELISIWDQLVTEYQQMQEKELEAKDTTEVLTVVVGTKGSGKSTLIDRFINPGRGEKEFPKPTLALDFKYARYQQDGSLSKTLANIFDFSEDGYLQSSSEVSMLTVIPKPIQRCVCIIVLDLSAPASVLPTLRKWLHKLREWAPGKDQNNSVPEKHLPELSGIDVFPYPLIIFATKWDLFVQNEDADKRKRLIKALRYFSLINGATLICTSALDRATMSTSRNILRRLLFGLSTKIVDQTSPNKPVVVQAGADTLEAIGGSNSIESYEQQGITDFGHYQPPVAGGWTEEELKTHYEREIDGVVQQRAEDLEFYRQKKTKGVATS